MKDRPIVMLVALRLGGFLPLTCPDSPKKSVPHRRPAFPPLLTSESSATAQLADAPPNHPAPRTASYPVPSVDPVLLRQDPTTFSTKNTRA